MQRALTSRTGARGFIVVAVLWILAALSALVLIYLTYVTNTAVVVAGSADRIQTEALVSAGVELAALQLAGRAEAEASDQRDLQRPGRCRQGVRDVPFRGCAHRPERGAERPALRADDRARRQPGRCGGLCRPYPRLACADRARRGRPRKFVLSHLRSSLHSAPCAVPGGGGIVAGARNSACDHRAHASVRDGVFSNLASINVLDAAPQVLAALPNMTPESLQAVLSQRGDPALDPRSLIGMAGGEGATLAGSRAYRIDGRCRIADGRRSAAEVVILLLEGGDEPYRVLSWRNASDGSTAPQRAAAR